MKAIDIVAVILVIVGALNWGMVGSANFNLVAAIFGQSLLASIVYCLVGASGVYLLARWAVGQKPAALAHA